MVRIRMELEVSSPFFNFAQISLCYRWLRLQLIAIHCNRRGVWTEHPHTAYFSFVLMEMNAFKPWLVRPANELNFSVLVCSSHVKRVLTRSDCADFDADFFLAFFSAD